MSCDVCGRERPLMPWARCAPGDQPVLMQACMSCIIDHAASRGDVPRV